MVVEAKMSLKSDIMSQSFIGYVRLWVPLSIAIGIGSGLLMTLFFITVETMRSALSQIPIYYTMIMGGIVTAIAVKYYGPSIQGSGVSEYIAARHGKTKFDLKGGITKFVTSSVVMGSGCIVGSEGPAIYVGGTLSQLIPQKISKFPIKRETITVLGGAAATAALFQAPLGGTIFAAEIPYRHDIDAPAYTPSFLAAITGFLTFRYSTKLIFGAPPRLLTLHIGTYHENFQGFLFALLVGLSAGLVGLLFVNIFWLSRKLSTKYFSDTVRPIIGTILAAITVFLIVTLVSQEPPLNWNGFDMLNTLDQENEFDVLTYSFLIILTILGTSFTVGFGVSGGVFAPALVVGGGVGGIIGLLLDPANASAYIVLGMSASHTATTKTPIASLVLIIELTGYPTVFLAPLAIANVVAYFVSGKKSLYTGQYNDRAEAFLKDIEEHEILHNYKVKDIMTTNVISIKSNFPVHAAKQIILETGKHTLPVVGPENKVIGIITPEIIRNAPDDEPVTKYMETRFYTVPPDITLKELFDLFIKIDDERVIVTNQENQLLGIVTVRDLIRTTRKAIVLK